MTLDPQIAASTIERMREELERTNSEVLRLTLELEDEVAERTRDNERLRREVERRQGAEREAEGHARQVEAANAELEAFCYAVSHDLRTPLRHIDGFSQALQEHCAGTLDDEGERLLTRVRSGCARMNQQIEDLLVLSRLSRQEMHVEEVDLTRLATEVLEQLRAGDPERRVETAVAAGLRARGDERLLRTAFANLLGNAWKFTSLQAQARIEVGSELREGETVYYVKDDGAGFNPKQARRIFGAFQRLHSSEQYPGNGIGLATVERVIRRHGGRIWAEGAVGRGATFRFILGTP